MSDEHIALNSVGIITVISSTIWLLNTAMAVNINQTCSQITTNITP